MCSVASMEYRSVLEYQDTKFVMWAGNWLGWDKTRCTKIHRNGSIESSLGRHSDSKQEWISDPLAIADLMGQSRFIFAD